MQANWSLILNVLLLIGVIIAIGRTLKSRRQASTLINQQPSVGKVDASTYDDIIAVRKVDREPTTVPSSDKPPVVRVIKEKTLISKEAQSRESKPDSSVMLFLLAKENRELAGYELLQTVLAAGLRFGDGNLFHRHQHPNGQGPVMCSLAAATSTGVFDLQNIGAFSVRGLCLFMEAAGSPAIDEERFSIMLDTAKQLSEGLDAYILDDEKKSFTNDSHKRYYQRLKLNIGASEDQRVTSIRVG